MTIKPSQLKQTQQNQDKNAINHYDVVIIGGAMVGSVLALGLEQLTKRHNKTLDIAIIEAFAPSSDHPGFDARAIALAHGSIQALTQLDIWQHISELGTAIKHIHISDRGHFGMTELDANSFNIASMGEVIELNPVGYKLFKELQKSSIDIICPAKLDKIEANDEFHHVKLDSGQVLTTKLIVAADGAQSSVRMQFNLPQEEIDFKQTALIANISLQKSHKNRAWERFTNSGPLALLPMSPSNGQQRLSMVWALDPDNAELMKQATKPVFLNSLQQAFGFRAGQFIDVGERYSYPLKLTYMPRPIHHRCLFVGNAAQTLHPIAGQGFNLGLRDIMGVLDVIEHALIENLPMGNVAMTHAYLKAREKDRMNTINRVEFLVRGFSNDLWPLTLGRNLGLRLLSWLPPLKAPIASKAMGFTTDTIL
ncbi:2-octaprenyl-6-methoxyphenyl hydroxylase [Parashewanella spongiae]|uniref:2-octaprenyl-6-methoxyphenyl hydroxylase n=1 Tax=Parashewanella spongiae TaxID=342950 RepID=UPI00105AAF69|nr:2-octaprenyl-6-methoxyphenyl hydroxylase [Parashewanella spongiae]